MLVFIAIAVAAFILVTSSFLFGGDHDGDHDHDHDHGGHELDAGGAEPTISVFSTKVLGTLLMGFGAAGAIASVYGFNHLNASLIGLVCGASLAGLMYLVLGVFYKQQASSLISTSSTVGAAGTVTVSIGGDAPGEVGLTVDGQYLTYSASSNSGSVIPKGQRVRVVRTMGSHLIVENESPSH
jgi:membrane protein implicated in regulation of membrane protease activity